MSRTLLASALALGMSAGCESKPPSPATTPDASPAAEVTESPATELAPPKADPEEPKGPPPPAVPPSQFVETMEALAAVHREHAERCETLGPALEQFRADHAQTLTKADERVHGLIDADEALRTRMRAAMGEVMTVAMACKDGSG